MAELFYPNPGLRSRSPRLGNRKVQSKATAFYPNPGDRDWERSRPNQMAATVCASGQRRFTELFLIKIDKMDSTIGFEISLIVVEAIRGRCASFMILTATVSEIFGGQTNSSILV